MKKVPSKFFICWKVQLREFKISMGVGAQAHESSPFYYIIWATFMSLSSSVHTDLKFSQLYFKKLLLSPNSCKWNLSRMHRFKTVNFSNFQNCSGLRQSRTWFRFPTGAILKVKEIRSFKKVHPKQISIAEVRGNASFFLK